MLMPEGKWQRVMANNGGGAASLDWMLRLVGLRGGAVDASSYRFEKLNAEVDAAPPLAGGVQLFPYLNASGVTAPFVNNDARGALLSIRSGTSRGELLRAAFEGVALSMADCYESVPCPVTEIRLSGGGSNSAVWCQIIADVMNTPIIVPREKESGARGATMAAGIALGIFSDWTHASREAIEIERIFEPRPDRAELYAGARSRFVETREAIAPAWARRAAVLAAHRSA